MHPILFRIPLPAWKLPWFGSVSTLPIYSYGVMLGVSLVVGWYLTLGLTARDGLPQEEAANCYVVTAVCALVGARALYLISNPEGVTSVADWVALRQGGLVAYGGFVGGFVGSWWYLRRKALSLWSWADVAVPSLATGLFLTRIGCYLFGCDYGKRLPDTAPAWFKRAGTFPRWPEGTLEAGVGAPAWLDQVKRAVLSPEATSSLPVHPTQLYESLLGLCLLGLVLAQRKRQVVAGQVFLLFTFSYGFARYMLEMVRDDADRGDWGPLLPEQVLVPAGLALFGLAYSVGMAQVWRHPWVRTSTRMLALMPAFCAYVALRPAGNVEPGAHVPRVASSVWVPAGLALLGFWFVQKVAQKIKQPWLRAGTQMLAFAPALVSYGELRPVSFVEQVSVRLSTSQWLAVLTGCTAALAYGRRWRAPTNERSTFVPAATEAVV